MHDDLLIILLYKEETMDPNANMQSMAGTLTSTLNRLYRVDANGGKIPMGRDRMHPNSAEYPTGELLHMCA